VNFSSSGPATSPAIAISHLNQLAGTRIAEVPYRGSAPAATAVMAGEVQGSFVFYLSAKQAADEGRVRVLAVAGAKRLDAWPDAPTMEEQGYKGFDYTAFVGIAAPKGTPPQIVARLNQALNEAIRAPAVRQRLDPLGLSVPAGPNTPEAFTAFMKEETARQATLAKLTGHSNN
jgi:tripartite-type tricarboxylate transporter receptor subunit TctC